MHNSIAMHSIFRHIHISCNRHRPVWNLVYKLQSASTCDLIMHSLCELNDLSKTVFSSFYGMTAGLQATSTRMKAMMLNVCTRNSTIISRCSLTINAQTLGISSLKVLNLKQTAFQLDAFMTIHFVCLFGH